jgi:hypothetical protein
VLDVRKDPTVSMFQAPRQWMSACSSAKGKTRSDKQDNHFDTLKNWSKQ